MLEAAVPARLTTRLSSYLQRAREPLDWLVGASRLELLEDALRLAFRREGATTGHADILGHQVWYADVPSRAEDAPTIVLVHGLAASGTHFFPLVRRLRRGYRVVTLDLPGYGRSTPATERTFLPFCEQLACTEAFVEHFAPRGAYLAGNSLGGWLSAKLAARRPDLVHGVALLNAVGATLPPEHWSEVSNVCTAEGPQVMDRFFQRLFSRPPPFAWVVAEDLWRVFRSDAVVKLIETMEACDFVCDEDLSAIRCPALLIWGDADRFIPDECRTFYEERIPHLRVERLARCGHCPQLERPLTTARLLLELRVH